MKACTDRQETLWLDAYGELDPTERPAWKRHLERCGGCRKERERMLLLLQRVKEAMPSPALSHDEAEGLSAVITRALNGEIRRPWWQKTVFGLPNRFIPALAMACLLIIAFGWFTIKGFRHHSNLQTTPVLKAEEQMIIKKDLDVIANLELLEELDALQNLLRVVDQRDTI